MTTYNIIIDETQRTALIDLLKKHPELTGQGQPFEYSIEILRDDLTAPQDADTIFMLCS